ncbi:MAG: nucleotidyl transferase AbiEii/AbiGii toxin family protein [Bacteroidales bacterium]|nr:nucleotidyl transferase AbiEii/AbiGii toxin family protein [Bacteroidales bacterium]
MLFTESVEKSTLELLKRIQEDDVFSAFFLVGGTALSLQIGHRRSIDLDFFTTESIDNQELTDYLRLNYSFNLDYLSKNTIKGDIEGVKTDFISHQYPLIDRIKYLSHIRMASKLEIAAMKLNAITGNGSRIKDFIDVAFLSAYYSLDDMLDAYERKYNSNKILALKSLTYFEDINKNEPIQYLNNISLEWKSIENRIFAMVNFKTIVFEPIG